MDGWMDGCAEYAFFDFRLSVAVFVVLPHTCKLYVQIISKVNVNKCIDLFEP